MEKIDFNQIITQINIKCYLRVVLCRRATTGQGAVAEGWQERGRSLLPGSDASPEVGREGGREPGARGDRAFQGGTAHAKDLW